MTAISAPEFKDEAKARAFLEASRWPDGVVCPFCGEQTPVAALPADGALGAGWYHCNDCRKKFTVRVGTLYERSHIPLHKWLLATHLLCSSKKGMSAHQLSRLLGITYKSAWFMTHRIREGMKPLGKDAGPLGGEGKVVEADETFIGKRDGKRKAPGAGGMAHKRDHVPCGTRRQNPFVQDRFGIAQRNAADHAQEHWPQIHAPYRWRSGLQVHGRNRSP